MRGEIEVTVGETRYVVDGDHLLRFEANCAHRHENAGEEMAAAIMMISYWRGGPSGQTLKVPDRLFVGNL